jgi:hypothetical protein
VLWSTSNLPRLEKLAPVPIRSDIRRGTQLHRVAERRFLVTLLIFSGSGHDVYLAFDVVAAVSVMKRSNLPCTCTSVAQKRHQRKQTDSTTYRSHGGRLLGSRSTHEASRLA